ncbi:KpsF/GutQ family sugar-phosphate isomerase [Hymenobacter sp. BT770]|uniref:KpsF/GutQ family sugar-phosphate isomerase n=1 Tax=Hymenobacter sp. BT770 TaxID=2886942 RepID=UPI001D1183F7|nr:KpsF/GutQ family sugar-phosphate isomerase [Hymenobacter sp. BT770]MCC3153320.1 KpsF/GutQ family sugar-phosphate isomerase [Hymenobacter sp. BT770]MDO3414315.1 KpsF/GutQ family sugar-phosphate isomerase [Hymenobacter sp. BT770]
MSASQPANLTAIGAAPLTADVLAIARQVLHDEAAALHDVAAALSATPDFVNCVQAILQLKGRVVVTGIGKSAHIAGKIVATLNSTGTPALFMHAADAIHGDLGMIQPEDFVVAISKSGDTPEIKVLVPLLRRKGVPLAALVSNADSYLGQQANFILHAPVLKEACPNNLAPTTSTTAALALGDALAVCLLESRQFTAADFARLHPGGTLGKRLYLKVGDLSRQNQRPQVVDDAPLKEVLLEISGKRLGATAVLTAAGQLAGIITDGDLRRMLGSFSDLESLKARDILTPSPATIDVDDFAAEALARMQQRNITQLVVTEEGQFAGFIHLHDLLREGLV